MYRKSVFNCWSLGIFYDIKKNPNVLCRKHLLNYIVQEEVCSTVFSMMLKKYEQQSPLQKAYVKLYCTGGSEFNCWSLGIFHDVKKVWATKSSADKTLTWQIGQDFFFTFLMTQLPKTHFWELTQLKKCLGLFLIFSFQNVTWDLPTILEKRR